MTGAGFAVFAPLRHRDRPREIREAALTSLLRACGPGVRPNDYLRHGGGIVFAPIRKDDDYDVLADGKVIGRILEEGSRFGPRELRWGWSITSIVPASPRMTNGTAATRKEAMAKFRAAWEKPKASG